MDKPHMKLGHSVFRDKVRGCWLGKGIGGALGMPYEGYPHPLSLSAEDLSPIQVPNDDLELQLLWIFLAEKHGSLLRAETFTSAWNDYFDCNPDEYGIARWNIRRGLKPPLTGLHNNWFTDGMGAAIRSEIWACLFPGQPALAAAFAREDAIVDHHGNGVFGEMLLAAAESAAFCCDNPIEAIKEGLNHIPEDCRAAESVGYALQLHAEGIPVEKTRPLVMERFGSHNFTDVSMNLAFITLGLAYGAGDFERTVLTAVNYGMDTDCTGATAAAFMGILMGEGGIPPLWRETAGNDIVVSDFLQGLPLPTTVDDATERTVALSARLNDELGGKVPVDMTPDVSENTINDGNQWLVFRTDGGYDAPREVLAAEADSSSAPDALIEAPQIHQDLTRFVQQSGDTVFLLTWISVPDDLSGQLMICANAGLTAWLDGRQVINYHGRLDILPAFHRTEGGASVPVHLKRGKEHLLKIRLTSCSAPLSLSVAVGDTMGRYVDGVTYTAKAGIPERSRVE